MAQSLLTYLQRVLTPQPKDCEDRSASLSAAQLADVERSLTNPDIRVALRADFPPVLSCGDPARLLAVVQAELAKCGETLASVGEVTIAYPQKDPRVFPRYNNIKGELACTQTMHALRKAWKSSGSAGKLPVKLLRANMIGETAYLNRSDHQGSLHVLTMRQQYAVRSPALGAAIPFLSVHHANKKHYFIIADQYVEQGTTVANLASYITHNGGHVLAAVHSGDEVMPLVPQNAFFAFEGQHATLKGQFGAAANNHALAALGFYLAQSAQRDGMSVDCDTALQQVEERINHYGHSLAALTHVEAYRLTQSLQQQQVTYAQLIALPQPEGQTPLICQQPRVVRL